MRTLLIDNHDSYTYNVFHLLAAASGEEPVVVNNDAVSWRVLSRSQFDAFVLSPRSPAETAKLVAQIVPRVASAVPKTPGPPGDGPTRVGPGLRREQQRGGGPDREPYREA